MRLTIFIIPVLTSFFLSCQENFDKRLQREAHEFTENHCPQEPEPGSRLDSTTYNPQTHTYALWYSLSLENENALRGNTPLLRRQLIQQLREDVNYKAVKEHGVTFRYIYRSQQTGSLLYDTQIEADEYKNKIVR